MKKDFAIIDNNTGLAKYIGSRKERKIESVEQEGNDVILKHGFGTDKRYENCTLINIQEG